MNRIIVGLHSFYMIFKFEEKPVFILHNGPPWPFSDNVIALHNANKLIRNQF